MNVVYLDPLASIDRRVSDLLHRMTFREKVMQLSCTIFPWGNFPIRFDGDTVHRTDGYVRKLRDGIGAVAYVNMSIGVADSVRYTNQIQRDLIGSTRLRIPALILEECCHGQLAQEATVFPLPPGLAATFDPDLVRRVFDAIGRETRARGGNYALSPVLDLTRDPRWGRSEETFGEDTFLVSRMGVAAVSGLQGGSDGVRPTHVASSPKHFAGFGQSAGGRQMGPAELGRRYMLDEVLPPFRAAVLEAHAAGIMPAYLDIDSVPCHANHWLLTDVLRNAWGFRGVVGSDFGGIQMNRESYRVCVGREESARLALHSGIDMDFPEGSDFETLADKGDSDSDTAGLVERSVRRVLELKFRLGLFEQPFAGESLALDLVHCPAHQQVALEAAEKSFVLLKNDASVLPLDRQHLRSVALVGPHSRYLQFGGVSPHARGTSIERGLREFDPSLEIHWSQGCALTAADENLAYLQETASTDFTSLRRQMYGGNTTYIGPVEVPLDTEHDVIEHAVRTAEAADVALVVLGDSSQACGENYAPTRFGDRDSVRLVGNQIELLRRIKAAGKPVVSLIVHGRALELAEVLRLSDAVVDLWNPGEARGIAVARMLFGLSNPGGKLPVACPRSTGQTPFNYAQKSTGWMKEYAFQDGRELLPFGFGLSYTTFALGSPVIETPEVAIGDDVVVSVEVTNTGARSGDEVVQVYLQDEVASVARPERQLKGFQRLGLGPGETKTVRIRIPGDELAFHGIDESRVIEPGDFTLYVGTDARASASVRFRVVAR